MNLDTLFDDLLTSGVTLADPQTIRKLRVLNTVHLVIILSAPFLGLFYFYVGAVAPFYAAVISGVLMALSLLALRKTRNITLGGNFAISILWVLVFVISWNTGGITYEGVLNPSWMLKGCLVLLAVFLMGYLHGTIWTLIAFFEMGLVVYLYRTRFQFPNAISYDMAALYHLATFLVGFLIIVAMAFLFQSDKEDALAGEQVRIRALREFNKHLDEVLERSPAPTFVIDRSHRVVRWNGACKKLTGLSSEDVLGKQVWEGFSMENGRSLADMVLDDPAAIAENFPEKVLSKSESGWFELKVLLPLLDTGRETIASAAPLLDEDGGVRGAIQTFHQSSASAASDPVSPDGAPVSFDELSITPIFKVDGKGKISFWNKACEEQFGHDAVQIIGVNASSLVARKYRNSFQDATVKALDGATSDHLTWRYKHKERKPLYVMARVYPVAAKTGEEKECAVVNAVVTELALKLRQAEVDAAEARDRLKNVSEEHELLKRNIATFIRGKNDSREA